MAWVYILQGSGGRHYIGSTTDLKRRFEQHCHGQTHTTKRLGSELILVAELELSTLEEARSLERLLKRKKNPCLAIYHLKTLGAKTAG